MSAFQGLKPSYELELFQKGYKRIIGIDEVGRGAWAGPLVLGAYIFSPNLEIFEKVNDSKKVTKSGRERLFPQLMGSGEILEVSVEKIDEIGVGKATEYGVLELTKNLSEKFKNEKIYFLLDGNFPSLNIKNLETVVDGDAKVYSIACASIVAKVYRDNLMYALSNQYPGYGFEKHVGYGTKFHMGALRRLGITEIHRKSYSPIAKLISSS